MRGIVVDMNSNTTPLALTVTRNAKGRYVVRFNDSVTGSPKRRTFRTERLARIFVDGTTALHGYWSQSVSASIASDVRDGNVRTVFAG